MAKIGGRRAFAAYSYAATATIYSSAGLLRNAAAFSSVRYSTQPSLSRIARVTLRPTSAVNNLAMSSTSSDDVAEDSKVDIDIASNIASVRRRLEDATSSSDRPAGSVRLVAVSKTKPLELLRAAYESGQRCFGENYAQELMAKSKEMPDDVSWHFIGPLQSNKAASLVKTVGLDKLACVETVSTLKLANKLNRAAETLNEEGEEEGKGKKLGVYLQVNTSGEESKSGLSPDNGEVSELIQQITEECPALSIDGLMTIGAPGDHSCFDALVKCRGEAAAALGREPEELELSMGMSGDFEVAVARGATSVRVGSTIFGQRDYSNLEKK